MNPLLPLFVAVTMIAMPVAAAEPARDLAQMAVLPDAVIYVRTMNGVDITGRFVRASSQLLVLTASDGRDVTLTADQIRFVWRRGDALRNGAIIGGIIGAAGAVGGQSSCSDCSAEIAASILIGVPLWAGVGALIDRQHVGRTLIYRSP